MTAQAATEIAPVVPAPTPPDAAGAWYAPAVDITVTTGSERMVIVIADDYPGLPEDERQVLAKGREEPLVHGQGLGLYLAYWIITNLNREINVLQSDSGTTTTIRLPTTSDPY